MSLQDSPQICDVTEFSGLAARVLDVDEESLKRKTIDDELTADEAEFVERLQISARSLDSGKYMFNQQLENLQDGRDISESALNEYKNDSYVFYAKTVNYKAFNDPDD